MAEHPIRFSLFFPQVGLSWEQIRERVTLADELGYHSVLFVDHMWSRGMPDVDHLEAWTLMTAAAGATRQLRIGALVLCNSYRNPALLAKMAASLDVISGGRLILGLGAGWMHEEYEAYGYPFPSVRERIAQLDEALEIVRRMCRGERASFHGKYYTVRDAPNRPAPKQQPHPPILVGGGGERFLLRVVARHADIWNCPNNHARELPRRLEKLREHCRAVGRDPDQIEISEQCLVSIGRDSRQAAEKWGLAQSLFGRVYDMELAHRGTPDEVRRSIAARAAQGVTHFTLLLGDFHAPESLELFAREVMPAFA